MRAESYTNMSDLSNAIDDYSKMLEISSDKSNVYLKRLIIYIKVNKYQNALDDIEKVLNMDVDIARGYVMTLMVFIQNIHAINCRSKKKSIFKINMFSNKLFLVAVFGSIGLQLLIMNIPFLSHILKVEPINASHMILLFALSLPILLLMEIFKLIRKKKYN